MRLIDADELKTAFPVCDNSKPVLIASVRATINHMPTIEPQRKKGKWIKHIDDLFPAESTLECNRCHHEQSIIIDDNYCPNCGADMREDAEEPKKCDTCKHEKERWPMWCHRCEYYLLWEGKE